MPDAAEGNDLEERTAEEAAEKTEDDENIDLAQELHNLATKPRSVSFNRDVHVKRIAPARNPAPEAPPPVRKQSLASLSKDQLAKEAQLVLEQAGNTTCHSTNLSSDRFHSLPVRGRKKKRPLLEVNASPTRRRSEELGVTSPTPPSKAKSSLSRSVSDASSKRPRNSHKNGLLNIFKKSDKEDNSNDHKKSKITSVKRSKSDVSDLKSSTIHQRLSRKRSGSESENQDSITEKKTQLSPIIEFNQSDDYFRSNNIELISTKGDTVDEVVVEIVDTPSRNNSKSPQEYKVNPIEKPPRVKDPKPPSRNKRSKTLTSTPQFVEPEKRVSNTLPRSSSNTKRKLFADDLEFENKDLYRKEIKKSIKETIDRLENKLHPEVKSEMIHSSQKPPEKLPLTKGHTVDNMVRILNKDQFSPPPKASLLMPTNVAAHNNNQPFSYTKPSVSPDPNLYARSVSPERVPTPVNKMMNEPGQGVIYAQVVCGNGDKAGIKQTIHTSVSPGRHSDEDEGLGYEDNKYHFRNEYDQTDHKTSNFVRDSPITPRFREYKNGSFDENCFDEVDGKRFLNYERGRGDGMDAKRKDSLGDVADLKFEKKKAELSYRRELLESRINARKNRDQISPDNLNIPLSPENVYDIEVSNPMDATKRYVSETKKYFRDDGNTKSGYTEDYYLQTTKNADGTLSKIENKSKSKYNPETSMFEPVLDEDMDRREFIDRRLSEEPREKEYFINQSPKRYFPPEPDYEPPSLDSQFSGPRYSPDGRKYKTKTSKVHSSSQDILSTHSKYMNSKYKQEKFGNSRDHYASNPEILHRDAKSCTLEQYDGPETFHNSLKRNKQVTSNKHYSHASGLNLKSSRHDFEERKDLGYSGETSGPESSRSRCETDRDRDNKFADSGIENDYRKDSDNHMRKVVSSNTKVFKMRSRGDLRNESEDEGFASSLLIASEKQHTEDNHSKSKYLSEYGHESSGYRQDLDYRNESTDYKKSSSKEHEFVYREKSIDDGSFYDPRIDKFEDRKTLAKKIDAKAPKSNKKISSLEKMKQLFSRDSSKKSKKVMERREVDMVNEQDLRRRYTEYRGPVDSDSSSRRNYHSDGFDYSQRRRLATPTPSPSPPGRKDNYDRSSTPSTSWFKSLDRLSSKKKKSSKLERDSILTTTEDELHSSPKRYNTSGKNPSKNLRFFGDTDQESNDGSNSKHSNAYKKRTTEILKDRSTLNRNGKILSSSIHGLDRSDRHENRYKSSSMSNLQNDSHKFDSRQNLLANSYNKEKYGSSRRDLHNISEIHTNSEDDSHMRDSPRNDNGTFKKPPMSPFKDKRRSRSHSGSRTPIKNSVPRNGYGGSKGNLIEDKRNEIRTSRQDLHGSRNELRNKRRRIPHGGSPAGSSTEGESSLPSQRSVVYLHAPTVGDIPGSRISRGKSRDDLSSVNSSRLQPQTKTVSRSFSVLAPWKPRHYREAYDINYSQSQHATLGRAPKGNIKPPPKKESISLFGKSKSASTKNLTSSKYDIRGSEDRLNNSSTLSRSTHSQSRSNGTLKKSEGWSKYRDASKENIDQNVGTLTRSRNDLRSREYKKSLSSEILERDSSSKSSKRPEEREKLLRSISMPKDPSKSAGWFKINKKSKKTESTNRLY